MLELGAILCLSAGILFGGLAAEARNLSQAIAYVAGVVILVGIGVLMMGEM